MRALVLVSALVALAGCGGSSSGGSGTGSGTSGSETPIVAGEDEGFDDTGDDGEPVISHGTQSAHELIGVHPPPTPWAQMSRQEREDYMVFVVLPLAAESFAHYDASRYAQFECANCHGDDAAATNYAMPSRYLPPLPAPGTPQWQTMWTSAGGVFMHDIVQPETAQMLGIEPFNPQTGQGFGCFSCHPHAGG